MQPVHLCQMKKLKWKSIQNVIILAQLMTMKIPSYFGKKTAQYSRSFLMLLLTFYPLQRQQLQWREYFQQEEKQQLGEEID